MWESPSSTYVTLAQLLVDDGHVSQDGSYAAWNIYNGGNGMSADGETMGVFGNNPNGEEDAMVWQRVVAPIDRLCLGNQVWEDLNCNGLQDAGEPGVAGAVVRLFTPGADGLIGGSGADADVEALPAITTGADGMYVFAPLSPGTYYVVVEPPVGSPGSSGVAVLLDNGVDGDNNGWQPGGPGTSIYSPVIELAAGTESVNDGDTSPNTDFTVDFGLGDTVQVGDLVWHDVDGDGQYEPSGGEAGLEGITVELLDADTDAVLFTTVTDVNGRYAFGACGTARYQVRIPVPPGDYPLVSFDVDPNDNGEDDDNNGLQPGGGGTEVRSPVLTLAPGTEPGSSGTTSVEDTIDFGFATCLPITFTPTDLPPAAVNDLYSQTLVADGGKAPYVYQITAGTLPSGILLGSDGTLAGSATTPGSYTFTVQATDGNLCVGIHEYTLEVRSLGVGNIVWVDINNDGIRQTGESGVPVLRVQLWSVGSNGTADNGGGDDALIGETNTDFNGIYGFRDVPTGSYYVRIPVPPTYFSLVSAAVSTLDNGVNNDNNALQPGGAGTPAMSNIFGLTLGGEPGPSVDGDSTDIDSTIDLSFANLDPCYTMNLIANPSFEFSDVANATGTPLAVVGYDGSGVLGGGVNAYQWLGGVNGTSGLGEPIRHVQVLAGNSGSKVSWVGSGKARHGNRYVLFEDTNSCVSLRPQGGGNWSSVLEAGKEYELSVWAANASPNVSSILWDLGANAEIFQILTGPTPGLYQYYSIPQSEMTGTPSPTFTAGDHGGWTEADSNTDQPTWRQYRVRFRMAAAATPAQIDTASIVLSGGSGTNPVAVDFLYLCQVSPGSTLTLGNLVWNDSNNNGIRDLGATNEPGVGGVDVELYSSADLIAGNADDMLVTGTTTTPVGTYNFTGLPPGNYVVKVMPTLDLPHASGTPVTLDNGVNDDNNGSQPGGAGTELISPVIALAVGTESTTDGDLNPDTELSVDFGLFSGIELGNQIWHDLNNDGVFQPPGEVGIPNVTVELLDGDTDAVLDTTTSDASGVYGFSVPAGGTFRIRIPSRPVATPLASAIADPADNGEDNDSNALQPAGTGTAVTSPLITLTPGKEPGNNGFQNIENTLDFGFRACPTVVLNPAALATATQYQAYGVNLSAVGGTAPHTFSLQSGSLPAGLSLTSAGVLSGTPGGGAAPGSYSFVVQATDANGCTGVRPYTLSLICPPLSISPTTLPSATQYALYFQTMTATGGTAPYAWSVSPTHPRASLVGFPQRMVPVTSWRAPPE
jgi:hypothetical protein